MATSIDSQDGHVGFQIAPMVDVVFVLMLFFMASAGMQVVEKELPVNTPSGISTNPVPQNLSVQISSDGVVSVNDLIYGSASDKSLPALREFLHGILVQYGNKDTVSIAAAPEVRHERIMDVLSAVSSATLREGTRSLSFDKITFR